MYGRRKKNKATAENVLPGAAVLGLIHAGGNLLAQRKENEEAAEHTNAHEDHDHTEFTAGCQLHHFAAAVKPHDAGEAAGDQGLIRQRANDGQPPPGPNDAQDRNQRKQTYDNGEAGDNGENDAGLDDGFDFLLRDPHFKAVLTGFHEVDH